MAVYISFSILSIRNDPEKIGAMVWGLRNDHVYHISNICIVCITHVPMKIHGIPWHIYLHLA